ncbi:hypothetical protein MTR67_031068 [Solanum verrucosum]|uniref:Uncharacterized protein n=1 Tax=Solanum verrucosum TaxID=315347 RepID=A0AAF0ZFK4_SOLVR|nr:hypothetical protein MTR67_031068 [Solanum verrucosum]
MVHNSSESSFVADVKAKKGFDPILVELKEAVLKKSIEAFTQGADGVLRYQGRLCVPNMDDFREQNLTKAHSLQYSIPPGATKVYHRMTKSAHFLPVKVSYSVEDHGKLYLRDMGLGTEVKLSTAFHLQIDGQAESTIQTLEDMLRACVIDFKGNWDDHFPLIEFSYSNMLNMKEVDDWNMSKE